MMRSYFWTGLAIALVTILIPVLVSGSPAEDQPKGRERVKWESTVVIEVPHQAEATLSKLGAEDWELTGVVFVPARTITGVKEDVQPTVVHYLKRSR